MLVNFWQFFSLTLLDTCLSMFCNFQAGNLLFVMFKRNLFESFFENAQIFIKNVFLNSFNSGSVSQLFSFPAHNRLKSICRSQ